VNSQARKCFAVIQSCDNKTPRGFSPVSISLRLLECRRIPAESCSIKPRC
jgi:hypothetical protein